MAFQDALALNGWLDKSILEMFGEYGNLGDMTYSAIWDVQQFARQNGETSMIPVRDAGGFFRANNGTGDYYPIDAVTYTYIMSQLLQKP